jgi:hypothetical protein
MGRFFAIVLFLLVSLLAREVEASDFAAFKSAPAHAAQYASWLARIEQSRQDYEAFAAEARRRVARQKPERGAPDYMSDDTLRNGDAIVTEKGLIVFTGEPGFRHEAADFRKLNQLRGGRKFVARLREIERGNARAARR